MKKISTIKFLIFTLALFASVTLSHSASVDSIPPYNCPEGGTITGVASITPAGPFVTNSPTIFSATGYILSSCSSRKVNLTAKNNDGTVITLIPDTTLAPGAATPVASTSFMSPAPSGTYKVTFNLGVEVLPPADLCLNLPGVQTTYNADLYADPAYPGDCVSVIRGTAWAGGHGGAGTTMDGDASFNNIMMKNITITSVGGVATSVLPFSQPLVFHWAYCARWNPSYSTNLPNVLQSSVQRYPIVGTHTQGECRYTPTNFGYPNSGFNFGTFDHYYLIPSLYYSDGAFIAWDGVHQGLKSPYFPAEPGFFSAIQYKKTGSRTARGNGEEMYGISQKLNTVSNDFADIKLPLDKLIISKIEIPSGYKLILTNNNTQSPNTVLETQPFTNAAYIAYAPVQNVTRVNVYIPGGFGSDLPLDGKNPTDHLPNGTYQVSVSCSSGTPTSIPSSFTLPASGIVAIKAKCQ